MKIKQKKKKFNKKKKIQIAVVVKKLSKGGNFIIFHQGKCLYQLQRKILLPVLSVELRSMCLYYLELERLKEQRQWSRFA